MATASQHVSGDPHLINESSNQQPVGFKQSPGRTKIRKKNVGRRVSEKGGRVSVDQPHPGGSGHLLLLEGAGLVIDSGEDDVSSN